jgi:hypothetical protein
MNLNLTFSEYCCAHSPVAARFAAVANYCSSFCGLTEYRYEVKHRTDDPIFRGQAHRGALPG